LKIPIIYVVLWIIYVINIALTSAEQPVEGL